MDQITNVCNQIAEKIPLLKQKGYEKGYADGVASGGDMSAWWDAFFKSMAERKKNYHFTGAGWNETTMKPDRTVSVENCGNTTSHLLFSFYSGKVFPAYLADGKTPMLDTSGFTSLISLFANCDMLERIEAPIDLLACNSMNYAFAGSNNLKSVKLMHVESVKQWIGAFNSNKRSLTDIGQENDDFGYFSASVDLSKTGIRFDTKKMSLFSYVGSQYRVWLKVLGDNDVEQTLTISSAQYQQTVDYALSLGAPEDYANEHFSNIVATLGWMLIVV